MNECLKDSPENSLSELFERRSPIRNRLIRVYLYIGFFSLYIIVAILCVCLCVCLFVTPILPTCIELGNLMGDLYIRNLVTWNQYFWIFEKVHISAEKGLFRFFFGTLYEQVSWFNCRGPLVVEYILRVWKYKNVFWEFWKKSIFWPKRVLSKVFCSIFFYKKLFFVRFFYKKLFL